MRGPQPGYAGPYPGQPNYGAPAPAPAPPAQKRLDPDAIPSPVSRHKSIYCLPLNCFGFLTSLNFLFGCNDALSRIILRGFLTLPPGKKHYTTAWTLSLSKTCQLVLRRETRFIKYNEMPVNPWRHFLLSLISLALSF